MSVKNANIHTKFPRTVRVVEAVLARYVSRQSPPKSRSNVRLQPNAKTPDTRCANRAPTCRLLRCQKESKGHTFSSRAAIATGGQGRSLYAIGQGTRSYTPPALQPKVSSTLRTDVFPVAGLAALRPHTFSNMAADLFRPAAIPRCCLPILLCSRIRHAATT